MLHMQDTLCLIIKVIFLPLLRVLLNSVSLKEKGYDEATARNPGLDSTPSHTQDIQVDRSVDLNVPVSQSRFLCIRLETQN